MKILLIIKNNIANSLSFLRIIIGILLLFISFLSKDFFVLYSIGIFTDMIDGLVARITHSTSEFGSKLDTIADTIFTFLCLILFMVNLKVGFLVYIFVGITFIIKFLTFERYFRIYNKFYSNHNILNKIMGLTLSLLPYLLLIRNSDIALTIIGIFSIIVALVEHIVSIINKEKLYA